MYFIWLSTICRKLAWEWATDKKMPNCLEPLSSSCIQITLYLSAKIRQKTENERNSVKNIGIKHFSKLDGSFRQNHRMPQKMQIEARVTLLSRYFTHRIMPSRKWLRVGWQTSVYGIRAYEIKDCPGIGNMKDRKRWCTDAIAPMCRDLLTAFRLCMN